MSTGVPVIFLNHLGAELDRWGVDRPRRRRRRSSTRDPLNPMRTISRGSYDKE
jgi:hypothetical protein